MDIKTRINPAIAVCKSAVWRLLDATVRLCQSELRESAVKMGGKNSFLQFGEDSQSIKKVNPHKNDQCI